jgi:GT2 family glycosyltransferase
MLSEKSLKNIRIIRSELNLGVPGGRNLLAQQASGEWLFFIDDDAFFVEPDMLKKIKRYINNKSDKLGAIACNIREYYKPWKYYFPFSKRSLRKIDLSLPTKCSYFVGGAHLIKRPLFLKTGGYNPKLFFFGEEIELSYRLINLGYEIHYLPDVLIIHKRASTQNLSHKQRDELILKNRIYLNKKYLPFRYRVVSDLLWLLWHIKTTKRPWITIRSLIHGKQMVEKKEILSKKTILYLLKYHGRLFY